MLLPIIQPKCHQELYQATLLAGRVLTHAASRVARGLDRIEFEDRVDGGEWLLKRPKMRAAVEKIMDLEHADRVALREAFEHDISFHRHFNDADYRFQYRQLSEHIRQAAEPLLVGFYEEILAKGGFTTLPGLRSKLDKRSFEEGYRATNPDRDRICPACLEDLPPPYRGRSLVDREHFLPKRKYAPLAVHPYNLLLTCIVCNQRAHRDDDPLSAKSSNALSTTFVPYLSHGLDELEITFNLGRGDTHVVVSSARQEAASDERIRNFDNIYGLTSRWSESLVCLHEDLMNYLQVACKPIDESTVTEALTHRANAAERGASKLPRAFLEWKYTAWLRDYRLKQVVAELNSQS